MSTLSSVIANDRIIPTNQRRNLRIQKEINVENKKLLTRLMYTPSSYPKFRWEKHAEQSFWHKERLSGNSQKRQMMLRMNKKFNA